MKYKVIVFSVMVLMSVSLVMGSEYKKKLDWSYTVSSETAIRLVTVRGDVELSTGSGKEVKIGVAFTTTEKSDLDKADVKVENNAAGLTIRDGDVLAKMGRVKVQYTLTVPEGQKDVKITTVTGAINARGDYKRIECVSVTGEIDFQGNFTKGILTSANGDIGVKVKSVLNGNLSIQAVNGSVSLELKKGSAFTLQAQTVTGQISNEFDLPVKESLTGASINGSVDKGSNTIRIAVVNGDISIETD
ncbi:MAG: DUF4097 family beta strand repeat-containing protein [Candidatus Omnitrophota bacterium]